MTQKIAVGEAIGAGFRLIGREPMAFAVWCAAYFLLSALSLVLNWGDTAAYYDALAASAGGSAASLPAAPFGPAQWLAMLVSLVLVLTIYTAIMRAVLRPDDRRFFYLRLGMRELWVALSAVLATLLWFAGYLAFVLVIGIGVGGVAAAAGEAGAIVSVILMLILVPLALWAYVWASLRLSMATVMSFAENRLRVLASWRFTKGHGLAMFLVGLALTVASLVVFGLLAGVMMGGLAAASPDRSNAFLAMLSQFSQMSVGARLAYSAVISVLYVGFLVAFMAPWAEMYRQLRPTSVAATFD